MKLRTLIIGGAMLSMLVGFFVSKTVTADSPVPGSSADPVVSKSYVDLALQEKVTKLEATVTELEIQSQALQNTINELQAKVNKTPVVKPTTPATGTSPAPTPAPKPQPTPTPTPVNSKIGQTAYPAVGDANVNLRSAPNTSASVVTKVAKGEAMTILQEKDSWYQVKLKNGTTGWVASWVVEVKS